MFRPSRPIQVRKPDSHYLDQINELLLSGHTRTQIFRLIPGLSWKRLVAILGPHNGDRKPNRPANPVATSVLSELKAFIESQAHNQRGERAAHRKHIAISYNALAKHIGSTCETVGNWVRGEYVPSPHRVRQIRRWIDKQQLLLADQRHLAEPNTSLVPTEEAIAVVSRLRDVIDHMNQRRGVRAAFIIARFAGIQRRPMSRILAGHAFPRGQLLAKLNEWLSKDGLIQEIQAL